MHIFSKHCYCRRQIIPFRSTEHFDEHAVARVFCPDCAERAPGEAFEVAVAGIPGWSGVYAIDWNQSFLEEKDPDFRDSENYYKKLFSSGDVTFGFLPKNKPEFFYTLFGISERLPSKTLPPGRAGRTLAEEEATAHAHRHPLRGSREKKRRPRGWGRKG
ncbi:hypothetical protein EPN90_03560 [Patescibacteria group bacterium]|nr:MAG: hypothetical protein EPN90_03560 [Patescibacteria group bacterium]